MPPHALPALVSGRLMLQEPVPSRCAPECRFWLDSLATLLSREGLPAIDAYLPRRARLLAAAAVLALAFAALVAIALLSRQAQDGPPLARAEEAVALGILDQRVLDDVRVAGEALGIVSLDWRAIAEPLLAAAGGRLDTVQDVDAANRLLSEAKRAVLAVLGDRGVVVRDFELLASVAVRFRSEEALLAALRLPIVTAVRADVTGVAYLNESRPIVRQPDAARGGHLGRGSYVAVLDTGVDPSDTRFFTPDSVERFYAAGDANGSALSDGHGTHVASTVLAMAPEARVIAVDVFRRDWWNVFGPEWSALRLQDGINHVIGLKQAYLRDPTQCCNVVAMNLSLGISSSYHRAICTDDYSFQVAFDHGIVPVVASGNDALDRRGTFNPGIGEPACAPRALSVGATNDGILGAIDGCRPSVAADSPAVFSQVGETLSILAPGNCIVAAGGALAGTSMAAPHVAGAIAVLAAAEPEASASEIWESLTRTGRAVEDPRIDPPMTFNRLDIAAAVERLLATEPAPSATPSGDSTGPSVRPPEALLAIGAQVQPGGGIATTVAWSALDDGGVARYELRSRRDSGDWTTVALPSATATLARLTLSPGSTYQFAVAAEDTSGNRSDWVEGPAFEVRALGEDDAAISYSRDGWTATTAGEALGGSLRSSSRAGAQACLRFQGRYAGWIATRGSGRGTASITLDGVAVGGVELAGGSSPRTVVYGRPADRGVEHVLCVRVDGSDGRPVDVDGFVVLR